MKELNIANAVINGEEQPTVNARDLWTALQSKQDFSTWIKNRLSDFTEGDDFTVHKIVDGKNRGRFAAIEYTLTLDTAKHLAMLERNAIGKAIRQYFIEFEKKARELLQTSQIAAPGLFNSSVALLDQINRRLLNGEGIDKEVLRYAWNVGRLIDRPLRNALHLSSEFETFVRSVAPGTYTRAEVYAMYCEQSQDKERLTPRGFWPKVRACRRVKDRRNGNGRTIEIY